MVREEKKLRFEDNCFDVIRLYAVLQVAIGHCVQHLQIKLPGIVLQIFSFPGVVLLFAISGFLVTASYDRLMNRSDGTRKYLKRRMFRIFPGLWCCCLINSIVIFMVYPHRANIMEGILYLATQFSGCNFYTGGWLREYGVGAPNGSLWTISVELQFYVFVLLVWGWLKKKGLLTWTVIIVCGVVLNIISGMFAKSVYAEMIVFKLFSISLFPYLYIFMIGAFMYRYLDTLLKILKHACVGGLAVAVILVGMKFVALCTGAGYYVNIVFGFLLAMLTIVLAYAFRQRIRIPFDISYGIYLYHMVIVNVMVECGMSGKLRYFMFALFGSIACGFVSWYVVEKRWLKRGKSIETEKTT